MTGRLAPPTEQEKNLLRKKGYTIEGSALNAGSFAAVYKASLKGQTIAVKVIDCELNSEDYRFKFLPRELYVLKRLKHPFITAIFDIFTINNRIFVFMELAEGDAIDMLKSGPLRESKAQLTFKQIASALEYMHGLGIAHRDLKCENVLLYKKETVAKLTDFGFSRICFDRSTGRRMLTETHCGSAAYVAPEVLQPGPVDAIRADCWSIGVVLFVFVNNRLPFTDKNIARQLRKQKKQEYRFYTQISADCQNLIRSLLNPDIKVRSDMKKVLAHRWIADIKV